MAFELGRVGKFTCAVVYKFHVEMCFWRVVLNLVAQRQNLSSLAELICLQETGWTRQCMHYLGVWMEVSLLLVITPSHHVSFGLKSCPLHPDSCSLNTEEWTWIFRSCTRIHRHSVLQRTPAIPTPSGETSVLCCNMLAAAQTVRPVAFQLDPVCRLTQGSS